MLECPLSFQQIVLLELIDLNKKSETQLSIWIVPSWQDLYNNAYYFDHNCSLTIPA